MLRPPTRRRAPGRLSMLLCGPFLGMRDSSDPATSNDPQRAKQIVNLYPLELDKPSVFTGRPGFAVAGAQGGASNKRTGQLVCQFTKLAGTEYTVRIIGGQGIQTYNWSTSTWTTVVSVANLTTASITLSETARIYAVTFADKLVISDGTNTPFTWDGTSGAGGLTKLTNAPVFYGQPTVYYAKLFAIKSTERNVIVWSEEQDATLGYETSPYSNSWQLGQTDQEAIYEITGTNEALYFKRAFSVGSVSGAVTSEFSTTGSREGISETVGTLSPTGGAYYDRRLWFIDALARPHVITPGGGVDPVWEDVKETLASIDTTKMSSAIALYDSSTQLLLFGLVEIGQTIPSLLIAYNPLLSIPVAVWRFTFQALGVVKNADGVPVLMHLSDDGYSYVHGLPTGTTWNDELVSGTLPIRHVFETSHLGVDAREEQRFQRVDLVFRLESDLTGVSITHTTPYGVSDPITTDIEGSGAGRWDVMDWDEEEWAPDSVEYRLAVGVSATGRWVRYRIAHEALNERMAVSMVSTDARPAGGSAAAA